MKESKEDLRKRVDELEKQLEQQECNHKWSIGRGSYGRTFFKCVRCGKIDK